MLAQETAELVVKTQDTNILVDVVLLPLEEIHVKGAAVVCCLASVCVKKYCTIVFLRFLSL